MNAFAAAVVAAMRAIGAREVRAALLFGVAALAFTWLIHLVPILQIVQRMPMHLLLIGDLADAQIKSLTLLVAIVMADRAVDAGAPRRATYAAAALGGCATGAVLAEAFGIPWRALVLPDQWPQWRPWLQGTARLYYWPIYSMTSWLLLGGFAVFFYADRRAAHKTEATLRAAELDRIRKREIALESRLQAMQARVEPQFLFNTLSQVERLYEIDLAAAERMLDNLIDYLRAAMPLMRRTSSTVAQELELARAYLAIVKARLGERLVFDIDVPAHAGDARLPPMMLLPLIDHAVAYGLGERHDCGRLRIAVEVAGGRLRLAIRDSGAGFLREDASDGVAGVRERLAALYGDDASLVLRCADEGATVAVMDIPFKPVAPDPPDASLAPGVLSQKFA